MSGELETDMSDNELISTLYGDDTGRWALIETPLGLITPPSLVVGVPPLALVELVALGEPSDVVTSIHNRHAGHKAAVQQALADLFGVSQQSVSRYIAGASRPVNSWRTLVLAWFYPHLVADRIAALRPVRVEEESGDTPVAL